MKAKRRRAVAVALMAVVSACAGAETRDASGADVQNTGYLTVVMDAGRLRVAKERLKAGAPSLVPALTALRAEADGWLKRGPFSVTANALTPPSGDMHDYLPTVSSISRACWLWRNWGARSAWMTGRFPPRARAG